MIKYLILILLLSYSCSNNKGQKQSDPTRVKSEQIGVRNAHMMVYNPVESKTYLFGGADHEKVLSDLWFFEDDNWIKVITESDPPSRTFGSIVYDHSENRIILFGGSRVLFGNELDSKNLLNDTWQFKNGKWEKINCNNSPTLRAEAQMVYDKRNKRILLFGGYTIKDNKIVKLGDTWIFEKNGWKLVSETGPSKRHGVSLNYDDKNEQIILFGGSTIDRQYGIDKGETWSWKNDEWEKEVTNIIEGIFNSSSAYNSNNKSIVIYGGWNGEKRVKKTLSFSNGRWTNLMPQTAPEARNHSQMVFDSRNNRMILFGGHNGKDVFGDTWEYINDNWNLLLETPSVPRVKNGH